MKEFQAIVSRLMRGIERSALATLVSVEGSSYRRPGARLLWLPEGERIGSISGGCLEEDLDLRAARVVRRGEPELALYDTTSENDLIWGVGLGCHGVVRVLIEPISQCPNWAERLATGFREGFASRIGVAWTGPGWGTRLAEEFPEPAPGDGVFWQTVPPPVALAVFGAGDDAQPLVQLAASLGWRVTVADPRPAYATAARFPEAHRVVTAPAEALVTAVRPADGSLAVVMNHRYVYDRPVLRDLLARPLAYLGLLGPRRRSERILADLRVADPSIAAEAAGRLHAPTGLDLGADGPAEVALSIVAEMRAELAGRTGGRLRDRQQPIHE
jgi:xanthine/CO dehydrogenase XdhC/CoxF family maturation factor